MQTFQPGGGRSAAKCAGASKRPKSFKSCENSFAFLRELERANAQFFAVRFNTKGRVHLKRYEQSYADRVAMTDCIFV